MVLFCRQLDYVTGPVVCSPAGGFYSAEDADSVPPKTRKIEADVKKEVSMRRVFVCVFCVDCLAVNKAHTHM